MAKIKSMDGHGSGLDDDLLDGKHGAEFAVTNHANPSTTYGVSSATNYGHAMASPTNPIVVGTASIGVETNKFARGDHVHPVQASVLGNSGTATTLQTSRTIATSGGATGTATSFNGGANITIPVTSLNPIYLSSATPIDKGGTGATTVSEALSNLGGVPISRTVNGQPLSADVELTPENVGAATAFHNHSATEINTGTLPVARGGTGATTLTSGNILLGNGTSAITSTSTLAVSKGGTGATTASAALSNLGGGPTSRTINSKPLTSDITLNPSDIGASAEGHTHDFGGLTSKPTTLAGYGITDASNSSHSHTFASLTSKPTTLSGFGITDGVPTSRTVNSKPLSANISLTAADVGAATTAQGSKADSAIQCVKVNGTPLNPDANQVVNVDAASINAATPEQGAKADSAIQGIQGNGATITPSASKIVNITAANIGAAPYEAKSSTDFNTMLTPGLYTIRSSSTNAPNTGTYHSLIVNRFDTGNYIQQIAIKESSYEIYLKSYNNSSWSAWK